MASPPRPGGRLRACRSCPPAGRPRSRPSAPPAVPRPRRSPLSSSASNCTSRREAASSACPATFASSRRIFSSKRESSLVGSVRSISLTASITPAYASAIFARAISSSRLLSSSSSLLRMPTSPAFSRLTTSFCGAARVRARELARRASVSRHEAAQDIRSARADHRSGRPPLGRRPLRQGRPADRLAGHDQVVVGRRVDVGLRLVAQRDPADRVGTDVLDEVEARHRDAVELDRDVAARAVRRTRAPTARATRRCVATVVVLVWFTPATSLR